MNEQKRQKIILVDDNQATLNMGKKMLEQHYEVYPLPSAERLLTFLGFVTPDLIIMDVSMPHMTGFDLLKILKANMQYTDIPVIFLTSKAKEMDQLKGLALGAVDYVTKPFSAAVLLQRIQTQLLIKKQKTELQELNDNLLLMVKQKTAQIIELQNSIIDTFAEVVEYRDRFTEGHLRRTQQYMQIFINYMAENETLYSDEVLTWESMDLIVSSAQLHDLGNIFISEALLNKPEALASDEFDIIKTHVDKGLEIIRKMKRGDKVQPFLKYAETIIGSHHEKWDGSGYPAGLKRQDIPLLGRMMALVDAYDALVSARPYKKPLTADEAVNVIRRDAGSHFDPGLVEVFLAVENLFAAVAEKGSDACRERDIADATEPEQ